MEGILANLNFRPLKEPRGFMRVLQFVFGICAFATTCSFVTTFTFRIQCDDTGKNNITVSDKIEYPFDVDDINTVFPVCDGNNVKLHIAGNFSSDSQFFVAVGVLAFLYAVAALILYCFFTNLYDQNENVPVGDFGVTFLFAVLWLAASSAWANSLSNLKAATTLETIIQQNSDMCGGRTCIPVKEAEYSKIVISIILGFLNMFLWGSNLWFLYKETRYFKEKLAGEDNMAQGQQQQQQYSGPPA